MTTALDDAGYSEIYKRVNRGYGDDYHPLGGMLAWKILADIRAADEGDEAASWAIKLQNTVSAGDTICKKPQGRHDVVTGSGVRISAGTRRPGQVSRQFWRCGMRCSCRKSKMVDHD